jgi:hypothetical protein
MTSTCIPSVEVVFLNEELERVNFEENTSGQFKLGWFENKENTCRGFDVLRISDKVNETYEYLLKDTSYHIAQPPLILAVDSAGNLNVKRFIDLRKDFIDHQLCISLEDARRNQPVQRLEEGKQGRSEVKTSLGSSQRNPLSTNLLLAPSKEAPKNSSLFTTLQEPSQNTSFLSKPQESPQNTSFFAKPQEPSQNTSFLSKPQEPSKNTSFLSKPQESPQNTSFFAKPQESPQNTTFFAKPQEAPKNSSTSFLSKPQEPPQTSGFFAKPQEASKSPGYFAKPPEFIESSSLLKNQVSSSNPFTSLSSNPLRPSKPEPILSESGIKAAPSSLQQVKPASLAVKVEVSEQPVTLGGTLIREMNSVMQSLLSSIEKSSKTIESIQVDYLRSNQSIENIEKKCEMIVNKSIQLTENVRFLQEKTVILEDKAEIVRYNSENFILNDEEDLDGRLFEDYKKLAEALNVHQKYFDIAVKPISLHHSNIHRRINPEASRNSIDFIKKTKTFQPRSSRPVLEPTVVCSVLNEFAGKLDREIRDLYGKIASAEKILENRKSTVYRFNFESDNED